MPLAFGRLLLYEYHVQFLHYAFVFMLTIYIFFVAALIKNEKKNSRNITFYELSKSHTEICSITNSDA